MTAVALLVCGLLYTEPMVVMFQPLPALLPTECDTKTWKPQLIARYFPPLVGKRLWDGKSV